MTFTRVKPAGWLSDVDVWTASEANGIDTNLSLAVDGAEGGEYQGAMTWSGEHSFSGPEVHSGAEAHSGNSTYSGKIVLSGTGGGVRERVGAIGDAAATVDTSKDVYVASATTTLSRVITLNDTGGIVPEEGDTIDFVNHIGSAIDYWEFRRETGGTPLGRLGDNASTEHGGRALGYISFIYTGGAWIGNELGGDANFINH